MRMVNYTYKTLQNLSLRAQLLMIGLFAFSFTGFGQDCPMVCNNLIQISLDSECSATITPDMILEGVDMEIEDMSCEFLIILYDEDGEEFDRSFFGENQNDGFTVTYPTVDGDYIGQAIEIGIWADSNIDFLVDPETANNCWSSAQIEDKIPNKIACPSEAIVLPCYDDLTIEEIQAAEANWTPIAIPATTVADATMPEAIPVSVTNIAAQYELLTNVALTIDAVDSAGNPVLDGELSVTLTSQDGSTVSTPSTLMNGTVILDDFFGEQTTDSYMNGNWIVTVTYTGAFPSYTINAGSILFDSQSALNNSFDQDNCDDGEITILSDVYLDYDCRDESQPYTMRRLITYGTDDGGAECILTINFEKAALADIVAPDDIRVSCGNDSNNDAEFDDIFDLFDENGDGIFDPSETGVPTIEMSPLWPMELDNACKFNVAVNDQTFETCMSNFKILRTFTIYDWCNAEIREIVQTIEQVDDVPPVVSCPTLQVMEVDSDGTGCTATFTVDPLGVLGDDKLSVLPFIFDCSAEYTVIGVGYKEANPDGSEPDANSPFEFTESIINNGNGTYTLVDLEGPRVWIQYILEDGCGNSVSFPVADSANQVSTCFLEVDIIDTTPPVAVCDEFTAVTLSADGWGRVYGESLDDGSYDYCSDVTFQVRRLEVTDCTDQSLALDGHNDLEYNDFVQLCCADLGTDVMVELLVSDAEGNTSSCMVSVRPQDKTEPVLLTCPGNFTLGCDDAFTLNDSSANGPTVDDNCGFGSIVPIDTDNRDECGAGTVVRNWFITNPDGTLSSLGCTQNITFDYESISLSDIRFPADLVGAASVMGCMQDVISPEDTGFPTYRTTGTLIENSPGCGNIAVTHTDQIFSNVVDACFKVIRTWTVIDWCVYDTSNPNGGGLYVGYQTIMLNNDESPEFTSCGTDIEEYCLPVGACEMSINFAAIANDGCTGDIITDQNSYSWTLATSSGSPVSTGTGLSASASLEGGSYTITWSVTGACDVTETCTSSFDVIDCQAPTPYCLGGITTVILPGEQSVTIWANDLDLGSSDQCDNPVTITFEGGSSSMTFDCEDLGVNEVTIVITDPSGNSDSCTTSVTIQANNGACSGASRIMIAGNIMTEGHGGIEDVEVSLEHMTDSSMDYESTLIDGHYAFEDILSLENYHLTADKLGDPKNGISTLDILLIQRHLLNLEQLDSPYKVIAADANNSESVTAADMVEIRKLILEIYDEFPNNKNWRFVDSDKAYLDIMSPWPLQEDILLQNILDTNMEVNWTGVKVGDVNGSVELNGLTGNDTEVRSGDKLQITMVESAAGGYDAIVEKATTLTGLQLELVGAGATAITSDFLNLTQEHTAINDKAFGMSYNQLDAVELREGAILFHVDASAATDWTLGDAITAEAYDGNLDVMTIEITNGSIGSEGFTLHQNTPNPFSGSTQIEFTLPKAGSATLEIMDITGSMIYSITQNYQAGNHTQTIHADMLPAEGLVYYRLNYEGNVQTKKMILLD